MKRNDWKIILGSAIFTYLFYQQYSGINFLIFAIVVSLFLFLNKSENFIKPTVITSLIGSFVSATFVYLYGTPLPQVAFVISMSMLTAFVFEPNSSLIVASLHGFASVLLAIPSAIGRMFSSKKEESDGSFKMRKILLLFLPLLVTVLFFFLYRAANPNFFAFTKDLNFDWLSFPLLRFFIFGLILLYGILTKQVVDYFHKKDLAANDEIQITNEEQHESSFIGKRLNLQSELFIGTSLLVMLNLLLGLVNGLDLFQLWPNQILPEESESFSQYLHNGVQMLIISIILAIGIILFFFRGYANYLLEAKWMKILGFIWIAQNVILLASTALRNSMYIEAYGLSHKRIGVFIYLLLATIGLILTFYKLFKKKNNGFLFRKNAWAFYAILILATPIKWDQIITDYNLQLAENQNKKADIEYLAELNYMNAGQLLPYFDLSDEDLFLHSGLGSDTNYQLNNKYVSLLNYMEQKDWQSSCLARQKNFHAVIQQHGEGALKQIVLQDYKSKLSCLQPLVHLEELAYQQYSLEDDWEILSHFKELKTLNLQYNYDDILDSIPVLPNLKALNLSNNYISDISHLKGFTSLERLDLRYNEIYNFSPLYEMRYLKELYLDELDYDEKIELSQHLPNTKIFFTGTENIYR